MFDLTPLATSPLCTAVLFSSYQIRTSCARTSPLLGSIAPWQSPLWTCWCARRRVPRSTASEGAWWKEVVERTGAAGPVGWCCAPYTSQAGVSHPAPAHPNPLTRHWPRRRYSCTSPQPHSLQSHVAPTHRRPAQIQSGDAPRNRWSGRLPRPRDGLTPALRECAAGEAHFKCHVQTVTLFL